MAFVTPLLSLSFAETDNDTHHRGYLEDVVQSRTSSQPPNPHTPHNHKILALIPMKTSPDSSGLYPICTLCYTSYNNDTLNYLLSLKLGLGSASLTMRRTSHSPGRAFHYAAVFIVPRVWETTGTSNCNSSLFYNKK